jgi:hypothetical protein
MSTTVSLKGGSEKRRLDYSTPKQDDSNGLVGFMQFWR